MGLPSVSFTEILDYGKYNRSMRKKEETPPPMPGTGGKNEQRRQSTQGGLYAIISQPTNLLVKDRTA